MAISIDELRRAASRGRPQRLAKSLNEAKAKAQSTAFLCHSHHDNTLATGLQVLFGENGWDVYIDWQDNTLPDVPNRLTADKIRDKIRRLDWFLFLATPNSVKSRWCPWEIGFADSCKPIEQILLIRTNDSHGYYGNEYLQLYPEIAHSTAGQLLVFAAGDDHHGKSIRGLK